jgi:hypothetical protein
LGDFGLCLCADDCRQEKARQYRDNRDNDQQLNQCKRTAARIIKRSHANRWWVGKIRFSPKKKSNFFGVRPKKPLEGAKTIFRVVPLDPNRPCVVRP